MINFKEDSSNALFHLFETCPWLKLFFLQSNVSISNDDGRSISLEHSLSNYLGGIELRINLF